MLNPSGSAQHLGTPSLLAVSGGAGAPGVNPQRTAPVFRAPSSRLALAMGKTPATPTMLTVTAAWRLLCARTGGGISRGTFYRWIREGKVVVIRLGRKMMVPAKLMDEVIDKCMNGEDVF